jgi:hypothetical protein
LPGKVTTGSAVTWYSCSNSLRRRSAAVDRIDLIAITTHSTPEFPDHNMGARNRQDAIHALMIALWLAPQSDRLAAKVSDLKFEPRCTTRRRIQALERCLEPGHLA